jgi:hypothetical protein
MGGRASVAFPSKITLESPFERSTKPKPRWTFSRQSDMSRNSPRRGGLRFSADFVDEYLSMATTRAKKPATVENEGQALSRWKAHLGGFRLDGIKTPLIKGYIELRQREGGCTLEAKNSSAQAGVPWRLT